VRNKDDILKEVAGNFRQWLTKQEQSDETPYTDLEKKLGDFLLKLTDFRLRGVFPSGE